MKKILLLALCIFLFTKINKAQTTYFYTVGTLQQNAGNPGNLNQELDDALHNSANGYTTLLAMPQNNAIYSSTFTLPFPFYFAGAYRTRAVVSNNGVLTFDTTRSGQLASPVNLNLTSNFISNNSIAAFWENFTFNPPQTTGGVYGKVFGVAPNRQYWIDWYNLAVGNTTGAYFSLVLEENTHKIYVVDRNLYSGTNVTASVGVKIDATNLVEVAGTPNIGFNALGTNAVSDNDYWAFSPDSQVVVSATVGTGVLQNTANTYPSPYGNAFWGARHQFIIQKAELLALGLNTQLTSLAFDVVTPLNQGLLGLSIALKSTTATQLTTWETGLQTVYTNASYTSVAGWNQHVFNNQFQWDTSKNLIVEVCFNNNSATNNAIFRQTATSYPSTIVAAVNGLTACANTANTQSHNQRPNMRFTGVLPVGDLIPPTVALVGTPPTNGCTPSVRSIAALATDNKAIKTVTIMVDTVGLGQYFAIVMAATGTANTYAGNIPAVGAGKRVAFYVMATDSSNNTSITGTFNYTDGGLIAHAGTAVTVPSGTNVTLGVSTNKVSGLKITEWMASRQVQGVQTVFPAQLNAQAQDMIEISNISNAIIDISGYSVVWVGTFDTAYTFPSGSTLNPMSAGILSLGNVPSVPNASIWYVGNANFDMLRTFNPEGWILKDAQGNIIDAAATNGYSFATNTGVTPAMWSGPALNCNQRTGAFRVFETNNSADFTVTGGSAADTSSVGAINPLLQAETISYQWKTNNVVIGNTAQITVAPLVTTRYVLQVSDGTCTATDSVLVTVTSACSALSTDSGAYINKVSINNFSQNSGSSRYSLFSTSTAHLGIGAKNEMLSISRTFGTQDTLMRTKVWVDFNADGQFNSSELIWNNVSSTPTISTLLTIPTSATAGPSKMRVMFRADSTQFGPCDTLPKGEVEDYIVELVPSTNDTALANVFSVTATGNNCTASNHTIAATVWDNAAVDSVWATATVQGNTIARISLTPNPNSFNWEGAIPAQAPSARVVITIDAKDLAGNFTSAGATIAYTEQPYTVNAGNDTTIAPASTITRVATSIFKQVVISEVLINRGQPGSQAVFPTFFPMGGGGPGGGTADGIEFYNNSAIGADISGFQLNAYGPNAFNYTFPSGTIIPPRGFAYLVTGNGNNIPAQRVFYVGGFGNVWGANFGGAIALLDPQGGVIDAVAFNTATFPATSGVTSADWSGNVNAGNGASIYRTGSADNHNANDWIIANGNNGTVSSIGSLNAGYIPMPMNVQWFKGAQILSNSDTLTVAPTSTTTYTFSFQINGCTSLDSFVAVVDSNLKDLAFANLTLQNSSCNLGANETLTAWVKNTGRVAIDFNTNHLNLTVVGGLGSISQSTTIATGSLNVNDSIQIAIGPFDLTGYAGYATPFMFNGKLTLGIDQVPSNDSLVSKLLFSHPFNVNAGNNKTVAPGANVNLIGTTNASAVIISEIMFNRGGNGTQQTFPAGFPGPGGGGPGGGAADMVELTNTAAFPSTLNGFQLIATNGTQTVVYAIPNGTVIPANGVLSIFYGAGTSNPNAGYIYANNGQGNVISSVVAAGVYLMKDSVFIVDAVAFNSFSFANQPNVKPEDFVGILQGAQGMSGIQRIGKDGNLSNEWLLNDSTLNRFSTMGAVNPGLTLNTATVSWVALPNTTLSNNLTASIQPTNTNDYVFSTTVDGCTITDTVTVNVSSAFDDIQALSIVSTNANCNPGANETVEVKALSAGTRPINLATKPIAVTLKVLGNTYTTTLNTNIINAGDTIKVFFNNVDLSTLAQFPLTSLFEANFNLNSDVDTTNNSIQVSFGASRISVAAGNDLTILPGDTALLTAEGNHPKIVISEVVTSFNGMGTQGSQAATSIPTGLTLNTNTDIVELTNTGNTAVDLSGWNLESYGTGAAVYTYTFPNGTILMPNKVIIAIASAGTDNPTLGAYYMGAAINNPYTSGAQYGLVLKNGTRNVDAVAANSFVFPANANVSTNDWNGNLLSSVGRAAIIRKGFDTNDASNWALASTTDTTTILKINNGLGYDNPQFTWTTLGGTFVSNAAIFTVKPTITTTYIVSMNVNGCVATDTQIVNVINLSIDMATDSIFLNPTAVFNGFVPVQALFHNNGQNTANNFTVSLIVNGNVVATDIVNQLVPSGGSYLHTFSQQWLPITNGTENVCVSVSINGDVYSLNDTMCRTYQTLSNNNKTWAQWKIYPNPANTIINVQVTGSADAKTLSIVDTKGAILVTKDLGNVLETNVTLDVNNLAAGIYFINVSSLKGVLNQKLMIIR